VQRAGDPVVEQHLVGCASLGAGCVPGELDDGVDAWVHLIDAPKVCLDDLDRGQTPGPDGRRKLACGGGDNVVESVHGYLLKRALTIYATFKWLTWIVNASGLGPAEFG